MARQLQNRGWFDSAKHGAPKFNARNYLNGSSGAGNLRDRGYPSSIGSGNMGYSRDSLNKLGSRNRGGVGRGRASVSASGMFKRNPWDDYLNQRNSMAQAAYDKSMGALNAAYGEYMAALQANLDSAKSALGDSYDRSKKNISDDATASLKQAYINKMLSAKNFDQQMSAQGLSGGASETSRASMENNYGNARNDINAQKARNLSELEGQYNDNLAQAMQAYNSAAAQAQLQKAMQAMDLENMLYEGQLGALDDYYSHIGDFGDDYSADFKFYGNGLNDFSFDPTKASNAVATPELIQSQIMGMDQRTQANLLEALKNILGQAGKTALNPLGATQNLGQNYLNAILKQLGGAK